VLAEAGPAPGTPPGTLLGGGLSIACGSGAVRLVSVQREGKAAMEADVFLRGAGALPKKAM
jgi:methionyl-tRNA formyltransferase